MQNKRQFFASLIVGLMIFSGCMTNNNQNRTNADDNKLILPEVTPLSENMTCEEMYQEIENDLARANYCQTNSDCIDISLGAMYIKFGCYHYVNKNIDQEKIYRKMDVYNEKCSKAINDCAPIPNAKCVNNKCVEK